MAKRRIKRNTQESRGNDRHPTRNAQSFFYPLESWFTSLTGKTTDEIKAKLGNTEWFVYLGILLVILIMPFLYSRATTENFLTPKEFTSRIILAFLGGVFCLRLFLRDKITLARTYLDLPLALFFGFCSLSVLWNFNAPSAIRDLRGVFLILLLYPLITNVVRSRWQVEILLWIVIFTGLATSALGIMETYNLYFKFDAQNIISFVRDDILAGKIDQHGYYLPLFPQLASAQAKMGSIVSTFGNRNYLGTFAMFTAFLPLAFFFYYRNMAMKVASFGIFGWMLFGLYITRCRAALIGIVVGIVYFAIMFLIYDRKWRLTRRYAIFFTSAISLIFVLLFAFSVTTINSTDILDKIKTTFTLSRRVSNTYERMWVWYGNAEATSKNKAAWLIGKGFGSFKHFFPYQEAETFTDRNQETFTPVTFRQAHNDWIQIISELGLVGLILFLFLVFRFFKSISFSIKNDVFGRVEGNLNGDHVLLLGLGAAMVAQFTASVPDFPFHRIETALYAVLFMGLVPVIAETSFFKKQIRKPQMGLNSNHSVFFAILCMVAAIMAINYEARAWKADIMVRQADSYMKYKQPNALAHATSLLNHAIELDPLPGDPYLKLATRIETDTQMAMQKGAISASDIKVNAQRALALADRAMPNINFNARSTYHSVIFRKMHIYYHLLRDLGSALKMADIGLELTCSQARSIYYMYAGKIALEISRASNIPAKTRAELLDKAELSLQRALNYKQFALQAKASLAVVQAAKQKWKEALKNAGEASAQVGHGDPTMLNIVGISASNLGDNKKAEEALTRAVALQPTNMIFKRDLGVVYVRTQQYAKARKYLDEVCLSAAAPGQVKTHSRAVLASMTTFEIARAEKFVAQKKIEDAVTIYKRLVDSKTIDPKTRGDLFNKLTAIQKLPAEKPVVAPPMPVRPVNKPIMAPATRPASTVHQFGPLLNKTN